MSKVQLSELQATIKELQKIGAFSEDELQWLLEMDKSVEELSSEMGPHQQTISFTNRSKNPDPVMEEGRIALRAHLSSEFMCAPGEIFHIPTGLQFRLPASVTTHVRTPQHTLASGIMVSEHYVHENDLHLVVVNYSKYPVPVKKGQHLGDLFFLYTLTPETFELKKN